jgi:hypothetical protein
MLKELFMQGFEKIMGLVGTTIAEYLAVGLSVTLGVVGFIASNIEASELPKMLQVNPIWAALGAIGTLIFLGARSYFIIRTAEINREKQRNETIKAEIENRMREEEIRAKMIENNNAAEGYFLKKIAVTPDNQQMKELSTFQMKQQRDLDEKIKSMGLK